MKKNVILLLVGVLALFVSCGDIANEPIIQGESSRVYNYQAQEHKLYVVTVGNRGVYNHKSDWWIRGIYERGNGLVEQNVDTLSNGDMRIAYKWLTCVVPRDKESIRIILQENHTFEARELSFETASPKGFGPSFTVKQEATPR